MRRPLSGLDAWLMQRASAVYMLLFVLYLLAHFLVDPPHGHAAWRAWALGPRVSVAASLFFAALLLHAWVGLRDVTLDYVKPAPARMAVLAGLALALAALGLWALRILWLSHS